MSTPIPPPLRAAAGLAAAAIDSARKVPQQLVGLPVLAISTALQASLKAQQAYAGLVARGDEVLGQLRGQQDSPPWATFDEDEEASARPRSAFDAVAEADLDRAAAVAAEAEAVGQALAAEATVEEVLAVEIAVEEVLAVEALVVEALTAEAVAAEVEAEAEQAAVAQAMAAEAALVEAELAADADRSLDPDFDPDVPTLAEAAEVHPDLAGGEPGLADVVPIGDARPEGSGTEPGADLPAAGAALAADAAATGAALAAESALDAPAADGTVPTGGGPADGLDGYLAVEPPVAGYDDLSVPQLRGRLRSLSLAQVEALLGYERANRSRAPYLTMLENRITTLRSR